MFIPKTVENSLRILDILKRADCEWVPCHALCTHMPDISTCMVETLLYRMSKALILDSKKGPLGGYKLARKTTLYELYQINAPTCLETQKSCLEEVTMIQLRFIKSAINITIEP
jgi:DNA-binding IscR family transcriptional regulator